MVEWIVSSSALIAVVILLRAVLKGKLSLRLQYALWAVVLVRLLVPVSIGGTAMSVSNLTQKAAASEPAQFMSALSETELPRMTYQAAYNEVAKEYADRGIQIEDMPLEEYAETVDYEIMNKMNGDLSIAEVVKIIWVCGIALVGAWFLLSNLRLHRSLKKTRTLLSDSHALPVYLSDAIDTPCLFGLFHPAIYLTSEAIESEHTQHHAVEHELTHFRHKDNIWAMLRSVCLAVHWFNPLVWCAAVLSRNDAELACDESTILRLGEAERASYGRTLIHLTCEKHPALLNTATTMTGSGKSIKERISLIVKKPKMALYTAIAVIVIAAVAVGCTFTGAKDQPASFEEWTSSLTGEAIEWAETAKGYGIEEISYTIPESEFDNLSTLLGTITDENCFHKKPEADDENGYRLALYRDDKLWLFKCLADGSIGLMFNDPETGAYYGSEGSLLIIEYPELWNYIVDTVDQKGISDTTMPIDVTAIDINTVPGAVIDYARNYIQQQIDYHNELGNNPPEGSSNYNITAAKITGLEQINTGTAGLNDGVALYRLEYRLLADHPENIVMAGGMSVESGWLTEYSSTGQPYLLMHYDDSGIETIWTPICVTNTDVIEVDYGTPEMLEKYSNAYTAAAMELWEDYQNSNEMERWENEHKLYGFAVQADGSYAEIGQQWAKAFVSQYVDVLSEDHPLKSTNCAVLKCDFFAETLETAPKKLIFNMRFACLAENQNKFEQWYAGWAGPLADEQYPQYAGWMEFGNFVVLEQTEPGLWTCTDAGTGGYGGWGWLNFEEAGEVGFRMEQLLSGEDDIMAELLLRVLPFINWSDFDSEWGPEGWSTLWQLLERSCISQGQVYGPEETRMWSDVYPDDQLYRNLYIMLATQNSDGAYTEGLVEILHKQREYDPELFDACLQQLTDTQQKVIKAVMSL